LRAETTRNPQTVIIEPEEAARRVRAARGYARVTRPELAERCGLTVGQIKLLEDGRRRVTTREELIAIGDACGVPTEFMDGGFSGVRGMYAQMAKLFGALLTQQIDEVVNVARELGLEPADALRDLPGDLLEPPDPSPLDDGRRKRRRAA
jgi:transcriptional regulator with XRE-family HTH domain